MSKKKPEEHMEFFITEKHHKEEELAKLVQKNKDPFDVGISKEEFLQII
jgi:hypothetical protein